MKFVDWIALARSRGVESDVLHRFIAEWHEWPIHPKRLPSEATWQRCFDAWLHPESIRRVKHRPAWTRRNPTGVAERFWARVRKTEACWLWTGTLTPKGYGHLAVGGRPFGAHRIAWALTYGPIPTGFDVCHHCDNPQCVRPDHLFLGTTRDNMLDAARKGRLKPWKSRIAASQP